MALNRFFNQGRSQYDSQYVPVKLPFELMQRQVAQTDAKVNQAQSQLSQYDPQTLGLQELGLPASARDYYGGTEAAIRQEFGDLAVSDYQRSQQSANQFNSRLDGITNDDFILKAATGEIATEFMKLNKDYKQHQNTNATFQARLDWKTAADKELAKHGADITSSPWLLSGFNEELVQMKNKPDYVPTAMPVIGKAVDRTKEILSQVNMLKDSGGKSIDYNNPLYLTWSSSRGVTDDRYAAFAFDILSDPNSAIRRDIEAQVDAHIQSGALDPAQRETAINSEVMSLVDTTRNLEHRTSDKGASAKSQTTMDAEDTNRFVTSGTGLDAVTIDPSATSVSDLKNNLVALNTERDRLNTVINSAQDTSTKNAAEKELKRIDLAISNSQYNQYLGNRAIESEMGYTDKSANIAKEEGLSLSYSNPEIFKTLFDVSEDGTLTFNEGNIPAFKEASATFIAQRDGISLEQARQLVDTNDAVNGVISNASTIDSASATSILETGQVYSSFKQLNVRGIPGNTQGKVALYDDNGREDLEGMSTYLDSIGVEHDGSAESIKSNFNKVNSNVIKIDNNNTTTEDKRANLEAQKATYESTPVGGLSNVDYSLPPTINLTSVPQDMINATYNTIGLEGTEVSVNGVPITDPFVKLMIIDNMKDDGVDKGGNITGEGGIVIKGIGVTSVTSEPDMQLLYAEQTGSTMGENQADYNEWKKQYELANNNPSAITVTMVPDGSAGYNNVKYAQDQYLNSDESTFEKSVNLTSTNPATYTANNNITQKNQDATVLDGQATEVQLGETIVVTFVGEGNSRSDVPVYIKTSKIVDSGASTNSEPTFEYTYDDPFTQEERTINVTGSTGQDLIRELLSGSYNQ